MTARQNNIITFGCRLNSFESEVIRQNLTTAKLKGAVVFNTCAVTAEATRQARQAIRRVRRERPDSEIIVTGCAAQIDPDSFAGMPEVDRVIGNQEKLEADTFLSLKAGMLAKVAVNDIMAVKETAAHLIDDFEGRSRAFVQIQTGCDHRCTFCIIPFGRGNSRSVPVGDLITQVSTLVEAGYKEVVLTGVDLTSYGTDLPGQPTLGELALRLLKLVPNLPRLRLSSIDCIEVDRLLLEVIANEPRLMPHLHLSLQSGDDLILKRMKRRHNSGDAVRFTEKVRSLRPDIVFGADFIAGFPTEDEAMFENTLAHVEACGLTYLHVFPYSAREGTPASRMPQLPKKLRKERAARLRQAGKKIERAQFDRWIGASESVLVERKTDDDRWVGYSEHFAPIHVGGQAQIGEIAPVRITSSTGGRLSGEVMHG
jgi:threonylcarbamoyladenosine tRNA methylthiotransferase MtaB